MCTEESEPVRPDSVDPAARYDEEEEEWVLGAELESDPDAQGTERRWRESGELLQQVEWVGGKRRRARYFHPEGSVAMDEQHDPQSGVVRVRVRCKPKQESDIEFPSGGLDERAVKVEYRYDEHGYMTGFMGWDAEDKVVTEDTLFRSLDCETDQQRYDSEAQAAAEWNEKGETFYSGLTAYILEHFVSDEDDEDDEDDDEGHPMDERGHMERYVLDALAEANRKGQGASFRERFAPAFEPLCDAVWEGLGQHVKAVCALEDRALVTVEDRVYSVTLDAITPQPGTLAFGASRDKRFFAKCGAKGVTIHEAWDGPVLRTLAYPTRYGDLDPGVLPSEATTTLSDPRRLGIAEVVVGAEGRFVVLACTRGVFLLEESRTRPLLPDARQIAEVVEQLESDQERADFEIEVEDPRAAISVAEEMIVVSGQFGPLVPIRRSIRVGNNEGGPLELSVQYDDTWTSGPVGPTVFHPAGERVLISLVEHQPSFFGMGGGTETHVLMPEAKKALEADAPLLDDYQGQVMMRTEAIHAACAFQDRFLLGMGDCYLWLQDLETNSQKFVFVGASGQVGVITSVDVSPDQQTIYVATDFGAVLRFGLQEEVGRGFITNLGLRDERRYLFLDTFEPMLW